jgi:predicted LPLAT superfamily acyltransferase
MPPLAAGTPSTATSSPSKGKSDQESQRWSQLSERGSLWAMRFTAWSYRCLGRRVCRWIASATAGYFFLTDSRGRRASAAYLRRIYATPEGAKKIGGTPGLWQSFLHYREFALSIVDRIGIWFGRDDEFDFEVVGEEHLDRVTKSGNGAILVSAHLGSFDALRLFAERKNTVVNVLMFTQHAERINTLFRELSPDMEERVIWVNSESVDSVFKIRECLRRGELVAVLGDRIEPGDQSRSIRIPMFGDPVPLSQAPYILAALLHCPVLMILAFRESPGRYSVFTEELTDRTRLPRQERKKVASELLNAYAARLDFYCTQYPLQWFNFFDYWEDETR